MSRSAYLPPVLCCVGVLPKEQILYGSFIHIGGRGGFDVKAQNDWDWEENDGPAPIFFSCHD